MQSDDKKRIHEYYTESLHSYGEHDARSVHWSDEEGQQKRFLILTQIADLHKKKVLDAGCGLGDLYKFFLNHHIDVTYTGIDIMPEFIDKARVKYPEADFRVEDISSINEQFDFVLASGALSFKIKDHKEYYFSVIKKMFELCRHGLAFNMLNKNYHVDDEIYATYDPSEVEAFCKTFSDNVQIVIGYLPQDFTMYVYKE